MLAAALLLSLSRGPDPGWVPPLPRPLTVVRSFAPPAERWLAGHRGVDLAAVPGSIVRAAGAGRIAYAGQLAGRGVVVVVHGGLRSTYEPVTAGVRVDDWVAAGAPIGLLAPGHDAARPAAGILHWGLLRGETYLDPMSLLSEGPRPVRLLPHWRVGRQPTPATRSPHVEPAAARVRAPRSGTRDGPAPVPTLTALAVAALAAVAITTRRPP